MSPSYPEVIYEREFVGYEMGHKPDPQWPGGANIAVNFIINYTTGSERNIANGDAGSEKYQHEINPRNNAVSNDGVRADTSESIYEYGSREGVPRLLRLFAKYKVPCTWNIATRALEMAPYWCKQIIASGSEIACASTRHIDYSLMAPEEEEKHISEAIDSLQKLTGDKTLPHGWIVPRYSNITPLLYAREHEKRGLPLLYSSDAESDDVPFWQPSPIARIDGKDDKGLLFIPVTHDTGDFRFTSQGSGWASPNDFYEHLKDTFDTLYSEGEDGEAKMMTVILHPHIIGRAGRCAFLDKFLGYITSKEKVWVAKREDIAKHWATKFPYDPKTAFGQTVQVPC